MHCVARTTSLTSVRCCVFGSVKNRAGAKTLERYAQLAAVLLRLPEELITLSDWRAPSSGSDNDVSWL